MKKIILITFVLFISNSLKSQTSTDEILNKFFVIYEASPFEAVDYVYSTNKWMERNIDGIEDVKNKMRTFLGLVGEYYGYEEIVQNSIGEKYKLVSYIVKYDRQPLRFTFIFYKPKDKWQVQNFRFDDNLSDELTELSKINNQK
ncbi:hypothetical protein [Aurantibacter sp.]|uniref:hypothetical protein n=1 Tax=Aurantibacter sp. TaxID=2807103 RepID=UPI0035C7A539